MAFGLLIWVAWITLLLDGSAGIAITDGSTFRPSFASQNLVDADDDFGTIVFDEGDSEDVKPANFLYSSYKPVVPKPSNLTPVKPGSQTPQIQPEVDRMVNGELRRWESKLFEPITFPLSSGGQTAESSKPMLPSKPQTLPNIYTITKPDVPTLSNIYKPSAPVVPSTGYESWKPSSGLKIPSGQGMIDTTSGYPVYISGSDPKQNLGGFTFASEDVRRPISVAYESSNAGEESAQESNELPQSFTAVSQGVDNSIDTSMPKYPQVNPFEQLLPVPENFNQKPPVFQTSYKPQSKPSVESYSQASVNEVSPPSKQFSESGIVSPPNWMAVPSFTNFFGTGFPDFNQLDTQSENSIFHQKVYGLPHHKPLRKSFVVRSKNHYQRGRFIQSKMTYTPDYKAPQTPVIVKEPVQGVKEQREI